jgi:proliferating cell nuclear antigen PCNA
LKHNGLKRELVRNTKMPPKAKKEDAKKSDKKSEYVLSMTLDDSSILRRAITSFKDHLVHARLEFDESGMAVSGMDASHIALINYKLHKNTMNTYSCSEPVIVGVHTSMIDKLMKMASGDDSVCFQVNNAKDKIVLSFKNEKTSTFRTFNVPVLDIDSPTIEVPDMSYAAEVTMKTSEFANAIKDFAGIGCDDVTLKLNESGFCLEASGEVSASCLFDPSDDREMALEEDDVVSKYGVKYMHGLLNGAAGLSSNIKICYNKNEPVKFEFKFGTDSYFISHLAPKADDD